MPVLHPFPQTQSHDFTFSETYSQPLYAEDLLRLANTYGLQHTLKPNQAPRQARLHIKPQSLKLQNPVLEGLKSKKIADLIYSAQFDTAKFDSSQMNLLKKLTPAQLNSLLLTLLFEHKLTSGLHVLWQLFDYTSLLRQANYTSIVPILLIQSGPLPSSLLPDHGRELAGLGLIEFPCFILYLPAIPDEALLDPNLTSGGILFIMKKYEDIKALNATGQEALRHLVRYFRSLPDARLQFLLGVGWQYMYSLNNNINEVTMSRVERDVIKPGEKVILTPKLQTWEEMWKEQAHKKGMQQGIQQGMQQGMQQGQHEMILKMLRAGGDVQAIARAADMSVEEVLTLKNRT